MQTLLIIRAFAVAVFLCLIFFLPVQSQAQIELQKSKPEILAIEDEAGLYANFYTAYQRKDPIKALGFANKYVRSYPFGMMTPYLQKYLDKNLPEHPDALKIFESEEMERFVVEPAAVSGADEKAKTDTRVVEIPDDPEIILKHLYEVIKSGASIDARSRGGYTVLMLAAMSNRADMIKILLEQGADINFKEASHGFTALTYAIWMENGEIVQHLLKNGADRFSRDTDGRNALDHAELTGNEAIIRLLKNHY